MRYIPKDIQEKKIALVELLFENLKNLEDSCAREKDNSRAVFILNECKDVFTAINNTLHGIYDKDETVRKYAGRLISHTREIERLQARFTPKSLKISNSDAIVGA